MSLPGMSVLDDYQSIQQLVKRHLRKLVLDGALKPGEKVDQDQIAAHFGVSRMPVREALRQLQVEGFVVFRPHRGVVVSEFSPEDVEEMYVVRGALESFATRLAVAKLSQADLQEMRRHMERMEAAAMAGDATTYLESDRAFHTIVYGAAGRSHLLQKIVDLWDRSVRYAATYFATGGNMALATRSHRAILDACEEGDADLAAELMKQNVQESGEFIARLVAKEGQRG